MRIVLSIYSVLIFFGCKNSTGKNNPNASTDSAKYFQLSDYIKSQISEVNKTPYYIYKIIKEENNRDSSPISSLEVIQLSKNFTEPDLNDPTIKKFYTENVFFDETTKNYSVSYSTLNKELVLQNVDVLLKEDGKTVKRIFLRKLYTVADSSIIEQLNWKPDEGFQINRLIQLPVKKEVTLQTTVVWNEKEKRI